MCPHCRAFITTDDRVCPYCHEAVARPQVERRSSGPILGGMIPPAKDGAPPRPAFFLLPRADVSFDDNWYTMGLAATGSKNTIADDVFVPAHRVVAIADLLNGTTPGASVRLRHFHS